eukprot:TRINITY_DN19094_c0_g4_i1.p1 TRINITY_DN19094_c0_g4~~TRINITY_DN19094_c0_g4_i1.p1  ORF type:complete len:392 (-),score=28.47 TRINITY_DN19094_c0_g4_i1:126-1301(-)
MCSFCVLVHGWCGRCCYGSKETAFAAQRVAKSSKSCEEGIRLVVVSTAGDVLAEPVVSSCMLIKDLKEEVTQARKIRYFTKLAMLLHEGVELPDENTIADCAVSSDDVLVAIITQGSLPTRPLVSPPPPKVLYWADDDIESAQFDNISQTVSLRSLPPDSDGFSRGRQYFELMDMPRAFELIGGRWLWSQTFDYCIQDQVFYEEVRFFKRKGEFTGHFDLSFGSERFSSKRFRTGRLYFNDQRPGYEVLHIFGRGVYFANPQQLLNQQDRHIHKAVKLMRLAVKEARGAPSCVNGGQLEFLADLHLGLLGGARHSISSWEEFEVDYASDLVLSAAPQKATARECRKSAAHSRKAAQDPCAASLSRRCRQQKLRREQVQRRWMKMNGNAFDS